MSENKDSLSHNVMVISFMGIIFAGVGYLSVGAENKKIVLLIIGVFILLIVGSFFLGYLLPSFLALSKVKKVISVSFLVLIGGFSFWYFLGSDMALANKEAAIDDYVNKYMFEEAREINSSMVDSIRNKNLKKITIAESKHWVDLENYEKALGIVDESWGIEDDVWSESDWQAWRYNIINNGVESHCEKRNFPEAKILAMKAADDLDVNGIRYGQDGLVKLNLLSMRQILFAKIADFEKILK